jgi:hypothetical protein
VILVKLYELIYPIAKASEIKKSKFSDSIKEEKHAVKSLSDSKCNFIDISEKQKARSQSRKTREP